MTKNITPLGAVLEVVDAPEYLKPGKMLIVRMRSKSDYRSVEVYLSPENIEKLMEDLVD